MPRTMRVEYPGAIYHAMDRGGRREEISLDNVDRQELLKTLAEACQKIGWQVHAYSGNHSGELHRETAEQKADRIIAQAMARVGWEEPDLACGLKKDPRKLAIAVRPYALGRGLGLGLEWPSRPDSQANAIGAAGLPTKRVQVCKARFMPTLRAASGSPFQPGLVEKTLSISGIAARVHWGPSKSANARLHQWLGPSAPPDPRQARLRL
jgi:hypothetical protein